MKETSVRYLFILHRHVGEVKEYFLDFYNNAFPQDWQVYVIWRKPWPKDQFAKQITPLDIYADEAFTQEISNEDIIQEEKWLGINFDYIIYMEDSYYSPKYKPTKEKKKNIARYVKFFREAIKKHNINFVQIGLPNEIMYITLNYVVRKLGIANWNCWHEFRGPRIIQDKCSYSNLIDYQPIYDKKLSYSKKEVDQVVNQQKSGLTKRKSVHDPNLAKTFKINLGFGFRTVKLKWSQYKDIKKNLSPFETNLQFSNLIPTYFRKYQRSLINNTLGKKYFKSPSKEDKYFYFPLHFKQDAQVTFREPYLDQIQLIKKIARSLPVGTLLYVKMHPYYLGSDFSLAELKQICDTHAVKLIHFKEDNNKLIRESRGVITINSTTGYEGLLLDKPVVTLGNDFYAREKVCYIVKNLKELPPVLNEIFYKTHNKIDQKEVEKLIYEYTMNTFHLSGRIGFDQLSKDDHKVVRENIKRVVVDLLARKSES